MLFLREKPEPETFREVYAWYPRYLEDLRCWAWLQWVWTGERQCAPPPLAPRACHYIETAHFSTEAASRQTSATLLRGYFKRSAGDDDSPPPFMGDLNVNPCTPTNPPAGRMPLEPRS